MMWIVKKRSDWQPNGDCLTRHIVGLEGSLRGICECWDAADAERIAAALNTVDAGVDRASETEVSNGN